MHKKMLIAATALIITAASCKTKTALDYSNLIVEKERSLTPAFATTEQKAKQFFEGGQFDSLAAVSERMEKLVDEKVQEIKNTPAPDVKGAEDFKKSAVTAFEYIKSIYAGYKSVGLAKTEEERQADKQKLVELVSNKNTVLMKMKEAQQQFAQANGFKIQSSQ